VAISRLRESNGLFSAGVPVVTAEIRTDMDTVPGQQAAVHHRGGPEITPDTGVVRLSTCGDSAPAVREAVPLSVPCPLSVVFRRLLPGPHVGGGAPVPFGV
jgi:hypothetical protein